MKREIGEDKRRMEIGGRINITLKISFKNLAFNLKKGFNNFKLNI